MKYKGSPHTQISDFYVLASYTSGLQEKFTSLHLKKGWHTEYVNYRFIKLYYHILRTLQVGENSLKPGMQQLRYVVEMLIESSYAGGQKEIM